MKSPFYRRLYDGLPADNVGLRYLPPITKRELIAAFDDCVTDTRVTRADLEAFVADPALVGSLYRNELFVCTSSGTTGHPGLFLHDRDGFEFGNEFTQRALHREHAVRARPPVLAEIAGESTTPEVGSRMSAAFDCEIHNVYRASEFLFIAFNCTHDWLHVNRDWAILEPVDQYLRPTPPGEPSHTVLLTNLANRIQPIIRYDLGDSVLVRSDPCPCGSLLPAIRVARRCDNVLRLSVGDGRTVAAIPLAIGTVTDETPGVPHSQLMQTEPATIRLRLDLEPCCGASCPRS